MLLHIACTENTCRPRKYIAYFTIRMPRKKLRRLLHNNGQLAAYQWAVKHQALGTLRQLAPKLEFADMERKLNKLRQEAS